MRAYATPSAADVEEFLQKLLASNNFDALVEKIADRAIEKLRNQQKIYENPMRPESNRDFRPNVLRNEDANDKLPKTTNGLKSRGQPGKIDNQAVKEKYASFPFDKLSLKYKSFTNGNPSPQANTKSTSERILIIETKQVKAFDEPPERQDKREKAREKETEFTFIKSDEGKKVSDFDLSYERPKPTFNEKRYPKQAKELPLNQNSGENLMKETYLSRIDDHRFNSQNQPRTLVKNNIDWNTNYKHIMPESLTNNFRAKEKVKPGKKAVNQTSQVNEVEEGSEEDYADGKVVPDDKKETLVEIFDKDARTEKSNVIIRRENGKQYTFVENSPDYDEYHENLAKEKAAGDDNEWGLPQ